MGRLRGVKERRRGSLEPKDRGGRGSGAGGGLLPGAEGTILVVRGLSLVMVGTLERKDPQEGGEGQEGREGIFPKSFHDGHYWDRSEAVSRLQAEKYGSSQEEKPLILFSPTRGEVEEKRNVTLVPSP